MNIKKIFCFCFSLIFAASVFAVPCFAIGPSSQNIYSGIDVSVYQGDIDFERVKSSGIGIVYIRAGAGSDYVDENFEENYLKARDAGLRIGFYYYVTALSTNEATSQAGIFAGLIDGKSYDVRPAMDYEAFFGLSSAAVNEIGLAFLRETERLTDIRPVIYSDSYRTRTLWNENFSIYPLWIADYNGGINPPDSPVWGSWAGFQYSDEGRVTGISGNVDLDRFTPDILTDSASPLPERPDEIFYTVRPGDTLSAIARRYGTTVAAIVRANNIPNPNLIFPGQIFRIPVSSQLPDSPQTPEKVYYTVRSGDTLWAISRRYGTTVSAIVAANGIRNPDLIFPGEVFLIP